jgi:hypothetical protein
MVFLKQKLVSTFMFSNVFKLREFGGKHPSTSTQKTWQNILNIIRKHKEKIWEHHQKHYKKQVGEQIP